MVTIVLASNVFIALICLWTAWQLLHARQIFQGLADTLSEVEQNTHAVLGDAPEVIIIGQKGVASLRQQLRGQPPPWQRLQLVIGLLTQAQWLWKLRPQDSTRSKTYKRGKYYG